MTKLVRELKKPAPPQEEAAQETDDPSAGDEALRTNEARWEPPQVQAKQLVATRHSWAEFGPMVAEAAWSKAGTEDWVGTLVGARREPGKPRESVL
jgi:hypothetical protein